MADYSFQSQWKTARNLVLSVNKQAAWGGALADAALTRRQRFDGSAVFELDPSRRSDQSYAGKGTSFATNGQPTMWDSKLGSFKAELSDWLVGFMFAFVMGTDTVTGDAAPYTHTFTFDESTRTAPATTVYIEDTDDVKYKAPDMAINDITLTINEVGAISAEMNMVGTGRQVAGAMAALPALSDETYLLGSDCVLSFGPAGAPLSMLGRHMTTTLTMNQQLVVHKAPGGGLNGIFIRRGNPQFDIKTTIAAKDTDDINNVFAADTEMALQYVINSGAAAQLQINVPAAHLKSNALGFDGDMVIWQLELDETTCYQKAGVPPITVQVINSVAEYLAVPAA